MLIIIHFFSDRLNETDEDFDPEEPLPPGFEQRIKNVPQPRTQAAPSTSKQSYQNMPPSRSGQSDFYPKNHTHPPNQSNFGESHQIFPPGSFPGYSNQKTTSNSYGVNTQVPPPGHKPHSNQIDSFGFCINEPPPEKKSQHNCGK